MTKQTPDPIEKTIPPQEWTKYNRVSGRKTLYLVAAIISIILVLSAAVLYLLFNS